MKLVSKKRVHVLLKDSGAGVMRLPSGVEYNDIWDLSILEHKGEFYWFTGGWSNRANNTGPFASIELAEQNAHKVLATVDGWMFNK